MARSSMYPFTELASVLAECAMVSTDFNQPSTISARLLDQNLINLFILATVAVWATFGDDSLHFLCIARHD